MTKKPVSVMFLTQGNNEAGPGAWRRALEVYLKSRGIIVVDIVAVSPASIFQLFKINAITTLHCYHIRGTTLLFMTVAKILGKKVVYTLHGRVMEELKTKTGFRKLLWVPMHSTAFRLADTVTFASEFLKSDTIQTFPYISNKAQVVRNATNAKIDKSYLDARLNRPLKNILSVTGFNYLKKAQGLDPLIEAVTKLKIDFPDITLTILGKGRYLETYQQKYKNTPYVKFEGFQNPYNYFADADLFVHSSFLDNSPMVILEAVSASIPTIGVRTGGIPELLPEQAVADSTADGIYQTLKRAVEDNSYRRAIVSVGQNLLSDHSISNVGKRMMSIYGG